MSGETTQLTDAQKQENRGPQIREYAIIFTLVAQFAVGLRLLARKLTHQHLWWDDWLMFLAALLSWIQFGFAEEIIRLGQGRHSEVVPPSNIRTYLMLVYCTEIVYDLWITLIKWSTLCLYIRLFRIKRGFVRLCYGMIGFVLAWFVGILLATIFQCTPIEAAWIETPQMLSKAWCIDPKYFLIGTNVPNVLADLVIIIMPMAVVWGLKLSVSRRIGLCIVFYYATSTTAIAIARVVYSVRVQGLDVTWDWVDVTIMSSAEGNFGVACACLPVLAPMFQIALCQRAKQSTNGMSSFQENTGGSDGRNQQPPHKMISALDSGVLRTGEPSCDRNGPDRENRWFDHGRLANNALEMGSIRKETTITVTYDPKCENSMTDKPRTQIYAGSGDGTC